jgi:type IV secretion system protein VirB10
MSDDTIGEPAAAPPSQDAQQPAGPPEPAAAPPKLDPETLAIRTKPESAIRFRRGIIIGIAAVGSVSLMAVTWVALKPQVFRQVTDAQELAEPSNRPATDALDALPSSYGDAPKLGPPLPGDLGGPILEHQRAIGAAPPAASIDRAAQAAEAERQRAAAERKAALESALMVQVAGSRTSPATTETAAAPAVMEGEAGVPVAFNPDRDPDSGRRQTDHLTGLGQAEDLNPHALVPPVSPYTLSAGTVIAASLITGLNSDLPGLVTAQVTEHVFDSVTGRILLIPQGSRLIGSYDSVVAFGQRRALVVWQRILLLDGSSIRIDNVPATDTAGYAGLAGKVDRHTWQLLKGVALSTLLGVGTELSFDDESDLVEAVRESTQESASRAGDQIVRKNLDIQPTITVRPGWPLRVVLHKDLVLRAWRGERW